MSTTFTTFGQNNISSDMISRDSINSRDTRESRESRDSRESRNSLIDSVDNSSSDCKNKENVTDQYKSPNVCLLAFDLLLMPIMMIRMILIYFWGSKYNLKGFQFLDVIMHADKPYFNQEDCRLVDTIGKDYRVVIRDDSRIFPMDMNNYFHVENLPVNTVSNTNSNLNLNANNHQTITEDKIVVGSTLGEKNNIWDMSTEEFKDDKEVKGVNKVNIDKIKQKSKNNKHSKKNRMNKKKKSDSDSESSDSDSSDESSNSDSDSSSESDEFDLNNTTTNNATDTNANTTESDGVISDISNNNDDNSDSSDSNSDSDSDSSDSDSDKKKKTNNKNIKGVNYFESDEIEKKSNESNTTKKKTDILDSIREELNSALELDD